MKLTGNKDVDRKILNNLEDKDLVKFCTVDKKANTLCNDQVFWMNRVFLKFGYVGGDILRKHKGDRSWSEYYIKDLRKINKNNAFDYLRNGSADGRLDHVIISLKNGANIHAYSDLAIRLASQNGHLDVVKYLVENSADINAYSDGALRNSSLHGHLDVVKYLVKNGADIHTKSDYPLRVASLGGYIEIVKYLVKNGANIHALSDQALIFASDNKHTDVVKYLKSLP